MEPKGNCMLFFCVGTKEEVGALEVTSQWKKIWMKITKTDERVNR
jgi:hypothetical protein